MIKTLIEVKLSIGYFCKVLWLIKHMGNIINDDIIKNNIIGMTGIIDNSFNINSLDNSATE